MEKIKVSLVEDEMEFQEWVMEELSDAPDIECVSRHLVAEDALAHLPLLKPDIVMMDLALKKSDMNGIECMLRLKLVCPTMKFLVITAQSDENSLFEALQVGASAYIQKGEIPNKLIELIRDFHAGGAPMSPGIARRILESHHKAPEDLLKLKQLSPRENEILDILSKGYLYKEAAGRLSIAEGTVKQHAHNIYQKLQVNNLVEAIRKYLTR